MATSVDAKLLKSTKFPPEFNQKVDMQKVNLEVMKRWIAGKISSILGNEDDVVIELCFNLIEGTRYPDIKKLQIQLTGFLEKDTAAFCKELWKLCLSAQSNPQGVPKELLEAKKLELIQEKIDAEKAADETRRRREDEERREREIINIRNREKGERGRGVGRGDNWRGGRGDHGVFDRGGRDFERRGLQRSRSPVPRRRDSRDRVSFRGPPPRDIDTYVPGGRGNRRRDEPRRRSRSTSLSPRRSAPRSRSPRRRRRRPDSFSPQMRRRTPSLDRRRGGYAGRGSGGRGRSPDRSHRRRSYSPSEDSRSRSQTTKKRRRSLSKSLSPSPPPRSKHRSRRNTSSLSRSLSSSSRASRNRIVSRRERSIGSQGPESKDIIRTGVNARKSHNRDERRLTRSNSRDHSLTRPHRRRRSSSRSQSRRGDERERKRRRSLPRYAPANRRRNTSSESSPTETRRRRADSSEDEGARRSPARETSKSPTRKRSTSGTDDPQEISIPPEKLASELREKLLREKIKKMRTISVSSSDAQTNNI